jgi:retron-type reverse transcriptase
VRESRAQGEGADGYTLVKNRPEQGGSDLPMQTSLQGIAKKARTNKDHRFGNLYEMLNEENLLDSWQYIRKNAACGVDKVSAREYEKNLKENISGLVDRLKSKSYKAKLIRRQYIPKDNGNSGH